MTASLTVCPKKASAVSFILIKTIDETSSGKKDLVSPLCSTWTFGRPPSALMTLNGQCFMSDWTVDSSNLRPIRRLASKFENSVWSRKICGTYQKQCFVGSWQPGSWRHHRWDARSRWKRHKKEWCGYLDRWQWFRPFRVGTHRRMSRLCPEIEIWINLGKNFWLKKNVWIKTYQIDTDSVCLCCHFQICICD